MPAATPPPPEARKRPPAKRPPVTRSLDTLQPAFRLRLEAVVADLAAQGYRPRVWETLRTPERGAWLMKKGASRNGSKSMHIYGVAADVVCRTHMWGCRKARCDFFEKLGSTVRKHGLYWGGDWRTMVDKPHVQAIPVRQQGKIRSAQDVSLVLPGLMKAMP